MKKLLITDVDNTLLDWQHLWFETFSAMSKVALDVSGLDPDTFYDECSALHQRHGTSEYAFVLTELPSLRAKYGDEVLSVMQPAIDAFRAARRDNLKLYPGVKETLDALRADGVIVAAYTESKAFYTNYRFRKLELDERVDFLYSPPDHVVPAGTAEGRKYDSTEYELKHAQHRLTPEGEHKPNPHILLSIVEELGFSPEDGVYVGDSLLKDVYMAQQAGILDVHAAFGAAQGRAEQYDLLKRVTHWTPEMVEREAAFLKPGAISPTHTLASSFAELLPIVRA